MGKKIGYRVVARSLPDNVVAYSNFYEDFALKNVAAGIRDALKATMDRGDRVVRIYRISVPPGENKANKRYWDLVRIFVRVDGEILESRRLLSGDLDPTWVRIRQLANIK